MIFRRALIAAGALAWLAPRVAQAQAPSFPVKPLRIVVPFGAGGIADLTARAVARQLADGFKHSVVVENRPGAGGVAAGEAVARAPADGHTLLLMSNATAVSAGLFKWLPFDAQKDFAPIVVLGTFDLAVLTGAESRFRSMRELIAFAKSNPGRLNLGTINVGSTQHLAAELLKSSAGIDVQVVPFNGSPAVLTALRGGQVDACVEILGPMVGQIDAGTVRPLAVMGSKRAPTLADVPTVAESGVRGFDVASWNALAAPAGTPPQIIAQLNRAANDALASAPLRKQLAALNVTPGGGSPAQLRELLASEVQRWSEVIARANVPRQ